MGDLLHNKVGLLLFIPLLPHNAWEEKGAWDGKHDKQFDKSESPQNLRGATHGAKSIIVEIKGSTPKRSLLYICLTTHSRLCATLFLSYAFARVGYDFVIECRFCRLFLVQK